jgi:hypothetical protein
VLGNQVQAALDEAYQAGVNAATAMLEETVSQRVAEASVAAADGVRAAVRAAIGDTKAAQ